VTLWFEGIDEELYRIYRARKPNSLSLSQKTYKVDGEQWFDLTKRNERDTQELIDKLLGRDHKTFIQSDFFGQGRERSFLALPGSEQRAVIEEILPLNSLDAWSGSAYKARREAQKRVDKAAENFRLQEERVAMARRHLKNLESQETSWSTDNIVEASGLQHKLNKVQLTSSGVVTEMKALKESLPNEPMDSMLSNYYNEESEHTKEISNLGYRIDTLTNYIDKRISQPEVCSECGRPFLKEKININEKGVLADKLEREDLIKQRGEREAKLYYINAQIGICREVRDLEERVRTSKGEAALVSNLDLLKAATNPFSKVVKTTREEVETENKTAITYRNIRNAEEDIRSHYDFWATHSVRILRLCCSIRYVPTLRPRPASTSLN